MPRVLPVYHWNNPLILDMESFQEGKPTEPEGTICCTDGSKIDDGPTGYGYFKFEGDYRLIKGQLGICSAVFQGKVMA